MNKKAIAILGGIFILIVATLGVVIYLRSSSSPEENVVVETPAPAPEADPIDFPEFVEPEPAPPTPSGQATKLTDDAVVTPALFFQGNGIAYFNRAGQLFRTEMTVTDGTVLLSNKTELTVPPKTGINRILWPAIGSSYITESGLGLAKQWSYYNPESGQYVDLPSQVKSLSWMPSGNKIVFIWVDANGNASLNISNPDTTDYQSITELDDNDIVINVSPDGQSIAFHRTQTTNQAENGIFTVSADGKNWATITRDGYNRGLLWSPDSKKLLFTRKDPTTLKYNLWYADIISGQTRNLGVATSETKAVWTKDSQNILVAVPTTGIAGEGITSDTFYKINVASATQTQYSPGSGVDGQELFLSLDEQILFFRNAQDGYLYYLPLQ